MAEGGFLQDNQLDITSSPQSACLLLECPICLEQMRQPKSLPCLHSFCEECLGIYIVAGEMTAVTSFPCPVCRRITSPADHSEGKKSWAKQFPTNSHVQHLINPEGVTYVSLVCEPCKTTKNIETPAEVWCETTKTFFCQPCKIQYHDVVHKECDIVTINETNRDVIWKQPLLMTCPTHNEKMNCYCEDDKFIGCYKCIITGHRRCGVVTTTKEYCEKQKRNSQLDQMDKFLEKASNCIELMVKAFDDQVEAMQQCQDVGLSSITELRQLINLHLDKKQEERTLALNSTYKTEKAKVDLSKQKCNRLKAAMQNTKEAFRMALLREDSMDTIHLFHRGQAEIGAWNDLFDDFRKSFTSVCIKHQFNISKHTSALTFGKITVERPPASIPGGVEEVKTLSKCRAKQVGTISLADFSCSAKGVVLLTNGHIVVSDCKNDRLTLCGIDGKRLDQLRIERYPSDLCIVDKNTVAVAVSAMKVGIHLVKVQASKLKLSSIIKMPGDIKCYGLAFVDDNFMVSTPQDIYRVTREGKADKVHSLGKNCRYLACDTQSKQTVASQSTSQKGDVAIIRLSTGFLQTNILREELVQKAKGVDVDREGNVYVCGQASNNVVQIPADGTEVRSLLTSADGVDKPKAISVCGDKFIVTNASTSYCYPGMHIRLYQLY